MTSQHAIDYLTEGSFFQLLPILSLLLGLGSIFFILFYGNQLNKKSALLASLVISSLLTMILAMPSEQLREEEQSIQSDKTFLETSNLYIIENMGFSRDMFGLDIQDVVPGSNLLDVELEPYFTGDKPIHIIGISCNNTAITFKRSCRGYFKVTPLIGDKKPVVMSLSLYNALRQNAYVQEHIRREKEEQSKKMSAFSNASSTR